jgi:hypothetical protein
VTVTPWRFPELWQVIGWFACRQPGTATVLFPRIARYFHRELKIFMMNAAGGAVLSAPQFSVVVEPRPTANA